MRARSLIAIATIATLVALPVRAQDEHAGHAMMDHVGAQVSGVNSNPDLPPDNDGAKDRLSKSPRHGEWVDITMAGGPAINSYVVYPERKDKGPVVIVVHDIGGMSDWARAVGDQLAKEGFIAIVPDLLSGKGPNGGGTASLGDQVGQTIRTLTSEDLKSRLDAVMAYGKSLPSSNGKTGTVGFCWGGGTVFAYALYQPALSATVSYYGPMPSEAEAYAQAKRPGKGGPILGLYGGNDNRVDANIPVAEAQLKKLGVSYSPHVFDGAGHGFLRNQGGQDGANFRAAEKAWPLTIQFLKQHSETRPTSNDAMMQDHADHMAMEDAGLKTGATGTTGSAGAQTGGATGAATNLPADEQHAKDRLASSARHGEFVKVNVGGTPVNVWVVRPAGSGKAPVVVVIQEIFGLSDWIRAVADQLAAEGFIAVAPDLLSGHGPNGGGTEAFATRDDVTKAVGQLSQDEIMARLDAAREYGLKLPSSNGKSATVGFCFGGSTSFAYAVHQPQLNAAVVYYGSAPRDPSAPQGEFKPAATLANIKAPVLGLYGGADNRIDATIPATEAKMKELGKTYEPNVFEGAGRGFLRAQAGQNGANMKASEQAWPKTLAFLRKYTGAGQVAH